VSGLRWVEGARALVCRGCGFQGDAPLIVEFPVPGRAETGRAARCPRCSTLDLLPEIWDTDPTDDAVDSYLEVGAGIEVIADLVDSLGEAKGGQLLDVGSGFGFGVDYAERVRGWHATGIEPSMAGARGARDLGVDVRTGYFTPGWSTQRFDAIVSSEVLEHVPDPRSFLAAVAEHLKPRGQAVLTTPDPDVVDPASRESDVYAVLSSGYHFTLYSRDVLEELLAAAGFTSVRIDRVGLSHRIRARLDDAEPVDGPATTSEVRYRYLVDRASATRGSLAVGLATRAFRRAIAAGDWRTARRALPLVRRAFRRRHRIDPVRMSSVDRALRDGRLPGALGGAEFALGMLELLDGSTARALDYFDRALQILTGRRDVVSLSDADSSDLLLQARFHRLLALARLRPGDAAREAADVLAAGAAFDAVEDAQLARIYVEIVARGAVAEAEVLEDRVEAVAPALAQSAHPVHAIAGRDALFSIGVRYAQLGNPASAVAWLEQARTSAVSGPQPSPDLAAAIDAALGGMSAASPDLSHYLDVYWCDPHGAFFEGWIHDGGDPGIALHVARDGSFIPATRHERADLEEFWPDAPRVRESGFRVYVPGAPHPRVELVLTVAGGVRQMSLELPASRLPAVPDDPDPEEMRQRIAEIAATAPDGPVLSIGARTVGEDTPVFTDLAFPGREVVGFDIHPGHRVSIVGDAHRVSDLVPAGAYPVIYSGSLLEHVAAPWLVAAEIARALPLGGIAIHVVPWLWPTHSEPNDFWRFSDAGLRQLFGPELGFEIVDSGNIYPAIAIPTPGWRQTNPAFATLTTPTTAWVVARKVDDRARNIAWPYDTAEGKALAERYPLDGLARDPRDAR
jgi:SAM-dependent methyltransferase